jgi:putative inorganic carbon (HCO3(-)) transporter
MGVAAVSAWLASCTGLWHTSWVGQALAWAFNRNHHLEAEAPHAWQNRSRQQVHGWGGTLGLVALLVWLTMGSTEHIAVGVWAVFGVLSASAAVLGQHKALQRPNAVDAAVLLFFATQALSACFSSYPHEAALGLFKMTTYLVVYVNFRTVLSQWPKALPVLLGTLWTLGLAQSVVGLQQYFGHAEALATWSDTSLNPEDTLTRVYGTLQPYNPNLLAGFLIPCLGAGLWAVVASVPWALQQGLAASWQKARWAVVAVAVAVLALLVLTLVLTGSRGGYLALGAMGMGLWLSVGALLWWEPTLAPFATWGKRLWWGALAAVGLGLAAALGLSSGLRKRVLSIAAMREDSSISYRLNVYASCWRLFLDNWLVGIGPGNNVFKQVYGIYMVPGYNALGAYSMPLEVAAEQGVIGVLAGLWLSAMVALKAGVALWSRTPLATKLRVLVVALVFVGLSAQGGFDTVWYRPAVQVLDGLWLAALSALCAPLPQTEAGGTAHARA